MKNMDGEIACMVYNTTHEQLSCLNGVKARMYLPVTVFLGLLVVVGSLGNVTVCLVYCRRRIRVSSHYFILSLAVLDLATCVIGMPTEMADLILPLTFESPIACKVLRFLHSSTIIASSTLLIEVAFDRYFRICRLGRQFSANKAKFLCVGALLMGFVFSWPSFVIFGKKTVDIRVHGHLVHGTDCTTDDSMQGTIYPTVYYLFLFSLFGLTLTFFTVLYAKIGLRIITQNKMRASCADGGAAAAVVAAAGGGGDGACDVGGAVDTACDTLSPQDRLAHVLRAAMKTEVETPSSDMSSDPSSQGPSHSSGSFRSSGFSGSFGSSDYSRSSGASGSSSGYSGTSGKSTRPLVETATPTRQASAHAQVKPGPLERLQLSNPMLDQAGVNHMMNVSAELLQQPRFMREDNSGVTNDAYSADETEESFVENNNTLERVDKYPRKVYSRRNTLGDEFNTLPRQYRNKNLKKKSRFNSSGLSCCCHCDQNDERFNYRQNQNGGKLNDTLGQYRQETPVHSRTCSRQLRVGKTTTVLFAVTLAYILSFLPYLTVMVMRSVVKGLEDNLNPMGELAYKFCVKSFFINNAINPIIYSFLNKAFRTDAVRILRNICRRGRRSRSRSSASV